jgi:hypothetical protein
VREASAALILFVLVASLRFLSLTGFPDDHYVHLAGAQQMLHGEWPSRDFVDLGAPLTYAISAAAQAVFGQRQLTEALLMATAFGLGAVLTLRAGVMLTGSLVFGLVAALIEVLVFPRTYGYPKIVLYSAAAAALLWYVSRPSRLRIVCLAGLVAIAALIRHDHGVYIGVAALVAVALSPVVSDRHKAARSVAMLAGAVFVFMLPYFIYLQTVDGIVAHIQRGMAFTALEVPRQRLTLTGLRLHDAWLLAAAWLAPVAALGLIAIQFLIRKGDAWSTARRVAPIAVLALVADAGFIRDRLDVRLPDAIVAPTLLMAWLIHQVWQQPPRPVWLAARALGVAGLAITMWYAAVMGSFPEQLDRAGVLAGVGRVPERVATLVREMERPWAGRLVPSAPAGELRPFFDYVARCIPPDQRLLVAAFLPEVAVLAQRPFAGGQVWFMAGAMTSPADHALVLSRLASQRVPVAVFRRPGYDDLARDFPELDAYITRHFTEMARWSLGDDDAVYLMMDPKQATGTDAKTGWPCFRKQ